MANDLNRCEFIGRLGANPEVRFMPGVIGQPPGAEFSAEWIRREGAAQTTGSGSGGAGNPQRRWRMTSTR